ncbi:MBL fold metallo-hydrolase [Bacillus sp. AFS001701]|uniref:MBL fold metallo-hydrolase n=1 Tax=Bacillus sp. AFS001701 TaxID=2033480 RepID=UPI000BF87803|nr:MBL fold metallo-hydrolase [Bacillus sp. AFS001701]PET54928.1 MBL fold metallo-hydrolase [Bacillus sp. AFS001701]
MQDLGFNTYLIDLYDLSFQERTGSYIILDEDITIIETSASPSHEYLLQGLKELQISLDRIKNVIVTHIHLDHSGGAGLLMEKCPNATLFVHPKGARHLEDPTKLIASAKQVYGDDFDRLFKPILPIDATKIYQVADGEELVIGKNRKLTFLHTPGHANHHISIFDSSSKFMFTGDTLGIYYPQLQKEIGTFILPSTSPNQFSYEATLSSSRKIQEYHPDAICFGHYGLTRDTNFVYESLKLYLDRLMKLTASTIEDNKEKPFYEKSRILSAALYNEVKHDLQNKNIDESHPVFQIIKLDLEVSAMGLVLAMDQN